LILIRQVFEAVNDSLHFPVHFNVSTELASLIDPCVGRMIIPPIAGDAETGLDLPA